jgi:hypothetical protein
MFLYCTIILSCIENNKHNILFIEKTKTLQMIKYQFAPYYITYIILG